MTDRARLGLLFLVSRVVREALATRGTLPAMLLVNSALTWFNESITSDGEARRSFFLVGCIDIVLLGFNFLICVERRVAVMIMVTICACLDRPFLNSTWPGMIDQGHSTGCYLTNTSQNQARDGSMESQDQELFSDVNFVARDPWKAS